MPNLAFTGRPMECAHCGHTISEHESIDECAACVNGSDEFQAEYPCQDYDH